MSYTPGDVTVDFAITDPDDVVTSGLVASWQGDLGVTYDGSNPTEWEDQIGGLVVSDADTTLATEETSPSGNTVLAIADADGGMTGSATGLPSGAADGTVIVVLAVEPFTLATLGYCGGGYGTQAAYRARILGVDGAGYAAIDYNQARMSSEVKIDDGFLHVLAWTYDGSSGASTLYVDGVEVASEIVTLDTGLDSVQILRTFNGTATPGEIGEVLVYDDVLSAAEIVQSTTKLIESYITPAGSVSIANATLGTTKTATSLSFSFDATLPGTYDLVLTLAASAPSVTQIRAGTDASDAPAAYAAIAQTMATENSGTATGLSPETTYYLYGVAEDAAGNEQTFSVTGGVTTDAAGVTTPSVSGGTIDTVTQTTAVGSVDLTDGADGQLYRYVAQASTFPSELQLLAGPSQTVTSAGSQTVNITGLTPDTDYWSWVMYVDVDGRRSNITLLNGGGANGRFSTSAVVTPGSGDYDRAADDTATWGANLVTKLNALSDTSGTTIIDITGGAGNDCTLDDIQFANRTVVLRPEPGNFGITLTGTAPYQGYTFTNGLKLTGTTRMRNTQGVTLYRMHFEGRDRLQVWGNCARTVIEQCVISGPPFSPTIAKSASSGPAYFFQPGQNFDSGGDGVQNLTMRDCVLLYGNEALMYAYLANDCLFEGLMGAWHRADVFKVKNSKRTTFDRIWMPRQTNKRKGAHVDGWQIHGIRNENLAVTNCVVVRGVAPNEGTNPHFAYQTVWSDNTNDISGFTMNGNIFCHSHDRMIKLISSSGVTCNNNDFSRIRLQEGATSQEGSCPEIQQGGSHQNNFGMGRSGSNFGSSPVRVVDTTADRPVDTDFDIRVDDGHHTGIQNNDTMDIGALEPPNASTQRHWDNANPKGAWQTLKGVFDTGDALPPNGWPCCVLLDTQFNANGSLRPKYTGFDQYGNAT